jgi:phosphatidyl-myo-inositol dimannoside synthase
MKALLLSQEFPPRFSGGISTFYFRLCQALGGVLAVLTSGGPECRAFDGQQPFGVYRLPMPVQPVGLMRVRYSQLRRLAYAAYVGIGQYVWFAWGACVRLGGMPAALLLAGHLYLAPLVRVVASLQQQRYAVFLHGGELYRYWGNGLVRRTMLWGLAGASFVVANSEDTARQYLRRGLAASVPIHIVHPGVDTEHFQPMPNVQELRKDLGIPSSGPILLSLARLVEWKGQDTVLRALPRIREACPSVHYVVAGSGPYRADLERLAQELGISEAVQFAGFVPYEALPQLLAAADVIVLPAREFRSGMPAEGFGITLLEAAACARPVVAGNVGGTAEAVLDGVTGLLVDPCDPAAVAGAVLRLLDDPELAGRMGEAGRRRALAEFTWQAAARRLAALIEEASDVQSP